MASYLKLDLVMTAFQRGPNVHLMGNPAVHSTTWWACFSSFQIQMWDGFALRGGSQIAAIVRQGQGESAAKTGGVRLLWCARGRGGELYNALAARGPLVG